MNKFVLFDSHDNFVSFNYYEFKHSHNKIYFWFLPSTIAHQNNILR